MEDIVTYMKERLVTVQIYLAFECVVSVRVVIFTFQHQYISEGSWCKVLHLHQYHHAKFSPAYLP